MENRRDELLKFSYVFNYKIKQLNSQLSPRQFEINGLINLFNNVILSFLKFNSSLIYLLR